MLVNHSIPFFQEKCHCNPWKIEKHFSEEKLHQQLQELAYEI